MTPRSRTELLDALRGSALLGILLLHSIQHWGCTHYPELSSTPALDAAVYHVGVFLFSGKAYAIFALMFGVSSSLILERWSNPGVNLHGRFLWRLAVLAAFGGLNGIVYCGDILLTFALLGIPVVFLHRLGNRALAWISAALFLQFPLLWDTGRALFEQGYAPPEPRHWALYKQLTDVFVHGSLLDVSAANLATGQLAKFWWTVETGRVWQVIGLFVCGLVVGRSGILEDRERLTRLATRAFGWGAIGSAILCPIPFYLHDWGMRGVRQYVTDALVSSYANVAQLAVWVGLFVLLYQSTRIAAVLRVLVPYGRMSLSCYVTQSLVGVLLFYGYGLALHRDLGPFHSILVGIAIFVVQIVWAHVWLRRFAYGPLERLWRALSFA